MKVDLNGTAPDPIPSQRGSSPAPQPSSLSHNAAEDKATLSLGRDHIAALTSQAMATSETRQDKIEALRQSIASGQYKVDPGQVAEAILGEAAKPKASS